MIKVSPLNIVEFKELLKWLSPDKEEAVEKYQSICEGLERFFRYRGCNDPNSLVDETTNRVAARLPELDLSIASKKESIFYGFAANIFREYKAGLKKRDFQLKFDLQAADNKDFDEEEIKKFDCLENCLSKLSESNRELILAYYREKGRESVRLRKEMADKMNITTNALSVRVFRIKNGLKNCIGKCLEKKM